ncbi:MAG: hypothetical protein HQK51_00595 [Oligoflexia bacterium]|nr:hypothetical protein [Oligoflexia bacterium]
MLKKIKKDKDKDKDKDNSKKNIHLKKKTSSTQIARQAKSVIKKFDEKNKKEKNKGPKSHNLDSSSKIIKKERIASKKNSITDTVIGHKKASSNLNKNLKQNLKNSINKNKIRDKQDNKLKDPKYLKNTKGSKQHKEFVDAKFEEKETLIIKSDYRSNKEIKEGRTPKRISDHTQPNKIDQTISSSDTIDFTPTPTSTLASSSVPTSKQQDHHITTQQTTPVVTPIATQADSSSSPTVPEMAEPVVLKIKGKRGRKKLEKSTLSVTSSDQSKEVNITTSSTTISNISDDNDDGMDDNNKGKITLEDDINISEKNLDKLLSEEKEIKEESQKPKELKDLEDKIMEEIESLSEDYNIDEIRSVIREIDFFNHNDSDECLEKYCENLQTTLGYCRPHYIKNWKNIRKKRAILKEGKLQNLIEELISKFPAKYVEAIMHDLSGDKEFYQVLKELNIDTGFQDDDIGDLDLDDDLTVETRNIAGVRVNYDDEDVI